MAWRLSLRSLGGRHSFRPASSLTHHRGPCGPLTGCTFPSPALSEASLSPEFSPHVLGQLGNGSSAGGRALTDVITVGREGRERLVRPSGLASLFLAAGEVREPGRAKPVTPPLTRLSPGERGAGTEAR